jgi:hypothetical protein
MGGGEPKSPGPSGALASSGMSGTASEMPRSQPPQPAIKGLREGEEKE